jgi:hypothetical protein
MADKDWHPGETLGERYARRFGDMPPLVAWGTPDNLDAMMLRAIARGRPLTEEEFRKAQGFTASPPPGADI